MHHETVRGLPDDHVGPAAVGRPQEEILGAADYFDGVLVDRRPKSSQTCREILEIDVKRGIASAGVERLNYLDLRGGDFVDQVDSPPQATGGRSVEHPLRVWPAGPR